jgi:peptide/nickel transport system substrate-binding protein
MTSRLSANKPKIFCEAMMKNCLLWATLLSLLVGAGWACKRPEEKKMQSIFRFNSPDGVTSLDPIHAETEANVHVVAQFYNSLFEYDEKLQLKPCLADSAIVSPDGCSYTIYLKKGVFFHDHPVFPEGRGREMKATDVVYSFKRVLDTKGGSAGAWVFQDRVLQTPEGNISDTCFVAADEYIVRIHLQSPFVPFLQLLSMPFTYIVPEEAVNFYGKDFKKHPVGTGAFVFEEWLEYNYLRMRKNPYYFKYDEVGKRMPYLDAVEISFISDEKEEFAAFEQGKIDFINSLSTDFINKILNKDGTINNLYAESYKVEKVPIINTEYIGIQMGRNNYMDNPNHPLLDVRIRQALNYAIDRREIVEELRRNVGQPATSGLIPPILSKEKQFVKGYEYNAKKVYELLAAAGYPEGKGLPELTFYTIPSARYLADYLQAKFRQFGIQIKIEENSAATHIAILNNGTAKIFRLRWLADYPDAENYLTLFHSASLAPGPNKTMYENPQFDSLYTIACAEKNDSLRHELYRQMEQMVMNDSPVIPIYYDESLQLSQRKVTGLLRGGAYNMKLEKIGIITEK